MIRACQKMQASETWPLGKDRTNFIDRFHGFALEKIRLGSLCDQNRPNRVDDPTW